MVIFLFAYLNIDPSCLRMTGCAMSVPFVMLEASCHTVFFFSTLQGDEARQGGGCAMRTVWLFFILQATRFMG